MDVLVVEDGAAATGQQPETPPQQPAPQPAQPKASQAKAAARPAAPPAEDDGDIGDEIQRILAAYSQNRKPGR